MRISRRLFAALVTASTLFASPVASAEVNDATRTLAVEIGFDAEAIAASGLSATDCTAILDRLGAAPETVATFHSLKGELAAAAASLEEKTQAAADGNQPAAEAIPQLRQQVDQASEAVSLLRANLREVGMVGLAASAQEALGSIDSARARRVPIEFMVVSRTSESWDAIEQAVRRESRCARTGETLEQAAATLLESVRGESAVSAAKSALAANKDAIEALLEVN